MRKIVFASHGDFAKGALSSAEMIIGASRKVITYSLQPGGSAADFADELETLIAAEPRTEFILVADLYGASVCSALYRLTEYGNVRLFAGFNLCFVLELLSDYPDPLSQTDVDELLARARSGIRLVEHKKAVTAKEEDF